jgi:hypothetical protein
MDCLFVNVGYAPQRLTEMGRLPPMGIPESDHWPRLGDDRPESAMSGHCVFEVC